MEVGISSCLKDSLIQMTGRTLASFLELEKIDEATGFPTVVNPLPTGWEDSLRKAMVDLGQLGMSLQEENRVRSDLLRQSRSDVMPISYVRSRDFAILTDESHSRFFVWLKMLPQKHSLGRKSENPPGGLIHIDHGEVFSYCGDSAIILPIQIGKRGDGWNWQYHRFLLPVMEQVASIQSAYLVRNCTDYYLHVSFAFDCPEKYEHETYLGIDRGVFFSMAYAVVKKDGTIVTMEHSDDPFREIRIRAGKRVQEKQKRGLRITRKDYKQGELDNVLHRIVNHILDVAVEHKSMLVLEDLELKTIGKFYKSAYKKMYKFLEYKAKLRGVPIFTWFNPKTEERKPGVFAAYTSQICIWCGEINKGREHGKPFVCPSCGATYHSDEGAGVNIARRAMYKKRDWEKRGGYLAFHKTFANASSFHAKSDLRLSTAENVTL